MPHAPALPRVTIALCTHQGAQHLSAQLESYLAQDHAAWDLWISDDGSTDGTRDILTNFATRHSAGRQIRVIEGPQQGSAANFMALLTHPDLPDQAVSLSDQDDVWHPQKLSRGLIELSLTPVSEPVPTLYGAQSVHTDAALRPIGRSTLPPHGPSFGNALTQTIVSGHTAILDRAALDLVRRTGVPRGVLHHDWWLYQLVTGAGGRVAIDPQAVLFYRQHGANVMGAHRGVRAGLWRLKQVLGQTYGGWIATNTAALRAVAPLLTDHARDTLAALTACPPGSGLARARVFHAHGIARQGRAAQAVLMAAVLAGRV